MESRRRHTGDRHGAAVDGQVLADDAIYLQRDPTRALWAIPRSIHLPRDATRHFPETESAPDVRRADGRLKIAIGIPRAARAPVPWKGAVGLCLLDRTTHGDGPVRVTSANAVAEMRKTLQGGFERFSHVMDECVESLVEGGCWRLPVGAEPHELVRRLDEMFAGS